MNMQRTIRPSAVAIGLVSFFIGATAYSQFGSMGMNEMEMVESFGRPKVSKHRFFKTCVACRTTVD